MSGLHPIMEQALAPFLNMTASVTLPDVYRGWTITRGRWPEPEWNATGPNFDAWTEGEGEWVHNGHCCDAATREALIEEIDALIAEIGEAA